MSRATVEKLMDYLIVPIRLDALILPVDRLAVNASADFSLLPYCDGTRDVNPDVANVSEDIVGRPLQDRTLYLRAGIHLHWMLPGPLTRGSRSDSGVTFPGVPNRWLVVRSRSGAFETAWVVESDYVYPDGEGGETGAVLIPVVPGAPSAGVRPFRYLGRRTPLDAWPAPGGTAGGLASIGYPGGLTAVGSGDPTFASFYPNCLSVFGLHDDGTASNLTGLTYDVLGWYDDPGADFLARFVAGLRAARSRDGQPPPTDAELADAVARSFGWTAALDRPFPTRMACAGRVSFAVPAPVESPDFLHGGTTVAVGNTGIEALSAFLARSIDPSQAAQIEDQLAAVQLASFLDHRKLDVGAKLAEGRHEGGFVAVSGGMKWTVRRDSTADAADVKADAERQRVPQPAGIAGLLDALNTAQRDLDRWHDRLESSRRQTFADWYKLMHCEYPPDDARDDYPDIDEVRNFIATRDLPPLRAAAGPQSPSTPVGRRNAALAALRAAVDAANAGAPAAGARFIVDQEPSPRYWQPTEPVVLLTGPAVRSLGRPGKGASLRCPVAAGLSADAPTVWPTGRLVAWLESLYPATVGGVDPPGLLRWSRQPWSPSLLQWEVQVLPVAAGGNLDPTSDTYAPDFITSNFNLPVDSPDLFVRHGRGGLTLAANVYIGQSLLTPQARPALLARLDDYLGDPEVASNDAYAHLKAARDELADPGFACLSQALSGFNEALLMHKRTKQLEVADPLGFPADRAFSAEVGRLVGKSYTSAPQPEWDFNPIRSGGLKVSRLRLVDGFGQVKDIDPGAAVTPVRMATPAAPTLVTLPPRLAQAARLNFRWLSAADGSSEANGHPATSPIVGWLVPDNLDGSLQVFDADGRPLGLINARAVPEAFPGGPAFAADSVADPHLRRVVRSLVAPSADPSFLAAFLEEVESALENIDPEGFAQHTDLALLMGRPIAVVRATLNLELKGDPAIHQAWNSFRLDLRRSTRDTDGFTRVAFPVRIGEFEQLNDGLVGYWVESSQGDGFVGDRFISPQSRNSGHQRVLSHGSDPAPLSLAIDDPPLNLTVLLDPRGKVHVTTGVLPVKAIDLPPEQYAEALGAIEVVFLSTPVVTRQGTVNIPRPVEAGYRWSWAPDALELGEPDTRATFAGPVEIREGWLKLTPDPPAAARGS